MNLKILFLAATGALLLSGCTLGFDASFEDLSLVRAEPEEIVAQYPQDGSERPNFSLTGMLRLDFVADIDITELKQKKGLNTWFEAETCGSKAEIVKWPIIYKNNNILLDTQDKQYHYSVFLNTTWRGHNYDLKRSPESICLVFGAGQLGSFFDYRSNIVEVDRDRVKAAFAAGQ